VSSKVRARMIAFRNFTYNQQLTRYIVAQTKRLAAPANVKLLPGFDSVKTVYARDDRVL